MISDLKKNIDKFVETTKTTITDKIIKNNDDCLNVYPIDYKYITEFRRQKAEERIKISQKIMSKYPQRVPIIVDCKKEINLDKNKYIVPNDLTIGQFMYILKKRIKINHEQSIFLLCNNQLIINTELINHLFDKHKDYDGFLYIIISLENTFGN
jgi:GABA(A) receptor-associated protein